MPSITQSQMQVQERNLELKTSLLILKLYSASDLITVNNINKSDENTVFLLYQKSTQ